MNPDETEQFRHICEVKFIASQQAEYRIDFFGRVEKIRGIAAATRLRNDVAELMFRNGNNAQSH